MTKNNTYSSCWSCEKQIPHVANPTDTLRLTDFCGQACRQAYLDKKSTTRSAGDDPHAFAKGLQVRNAQRTGKVDPLKGFKNLASELDYIVRMQDVDFTTGKTEHRGYHTFGAKNTGERLAMILDQIGDDDDDVSYEIRDRINKAIAKDQKRQDKKYFPRIVLAHAINMNGGKR